MLAKKEIVIAESLPLIVLVVKPAILRKAQAQVARGGLVVCGVSISRPPISFCMIGLTQYLIHCTDVPDNSLYAWPLRDIT